MGERLPTIDRTGEAAALHLHGTLMLTDVAGWTSMVEQLSAAGPRGLDELGRAMNAYAISLVETVYGYGGDVLSVNGDAFLCCWLAVDPDGVAETAVEAARAAVAFQRSVADRPTAGDRPLQTRIGISSGELEIAIVGGLNGRWELLPIGKGLEQVALAERLAPSGSVAAAPSAWERLAPIATGRELEHLGAVEVTAVKGTRQPTRAPERRLELSPELLTPLVPAPVRGWRLASGTEWLAELRYVTTVMVRLLGEGAGLASRIETCQLAVRMFQETISRYEGASKPTLDSKGMTLSAVFGLPPRAHENDPERAVAVAARLISQFAAAGLPCSVGIAGGRAFCGLFGSDLRRDYTLHGNVVNLAARLAYAGEGEVLCDEETARAVGERYRFESLPPVTLKGRADPVPMSRLVEVLSKSASPSAELIDRIDERAALGERIDLLHTLGERGALVIEGDAGIGKSMLVAEGARLASESGIKVLRAASDSIERSTAYYAWRPVFESLLGWTDAPDPDALVRMLADRLEGVPDLLRLAPLLSSVAPFAIPDNELTGAMTGEARADNTIVLLTGILSRLTASEPVTLIVEDAHWLDSSSWALLEAVVRGVPGLLTMITTRPVPADSREAAALRTLQPYVPVRLGSLAPSHTAALVRQRLGVTEIPAALSQLIENRVAGHPYFCTALVKAMQERGVVRIEDGTAVISGLQELDVPATVEGAVLSLVDRLSPRQQLSLKVAAVVGSTFSTRTVVDVYPVFDERESVPEDLRALHDLDLIVPDLGGGEMFAFRHEIAREVTYELLTDSQRRPLHRAVAEWYERTHTEGELVPHDPLLAHHWLSAGERAKAVPYLERAGRAALRGGAFREAAHFYAQLRSDESTEADPARRAMWEKGEAAAHYFFGDLVRTRTLLESALAKLDREVPESKGAMARGAARVAAVQLAHLARPERYRRRRAAERDKLDEAVDAYKVLMQVNYLNGESPVELIYLTLSGVNIGEEAGPSPHLARLLATIAAVSSLANLRRLADHYAARAVRLAEHEGQSEALAYVWNVLALMEAQRGKWRRATAASDRALELFGEVGDYNLEGELWQTRAAIQLCRGEFRGAEASWTRTRELAERNDNPQLECWSLLDEVQHRLGRDEIDRAAAALEAALAIETAPSDGGSEIEKHYCVAATRLAQGEDVEALRAAERVMEMVTSQPPSGFHWAEFATDTTRVVLDLLESGTSAASRTDLEQRARAYCRALRKIGWTFHGIRSRRWLLEGRLAHACERNDQAVRALRRARSIAAALEGEYDHALAELELARLAPAGAERDRLRTEAIQTFERLGAIRSRKLAEQG